MDESQRWRWRQDAEDVVFLRRVLIVLALVVLALVLWVLADVLLLAFGAVLVAVLLHAFADVLSRHTPIPERWALTAAGLIILIGFLAVMAMFGAQLRFQIQNLAERLPFAIDNFTQELGLGEITKQLPQMLGLGPGGGFVSRLAGIGASIVGGIADFLLVVIAGVYIAAAPRIYRKGLVKLLPISQHERAESSLQAVGDALKLWLTAQLIAMTCVGVLTTLATWMIGLPSPVALGVIAGLADFIPLIGPIIGALPAILIAFSQDGSAVLWTILAFVAIQQIEGNVIFPLVGGRMVDVPPALALFAVVAGGVLFGTLGMIFGFPLAVVAYVLVKKLYVRETLGESTPVPGEDKTSDEVSPG
jgi:predicted PurR-regulated permease PerM